MRFCDDTRKTCHYFRSSNNEVELVADHQEAFLNLANAGEVVHAVVEVRWGFADVEEGTFEVLFRHRLVQCLDEFEHGLGNIGKFVATNTTEDSREVFFEEVKVVEDRGVVRTVDDCGTFGEGG